MRKAEQTAVILDLFKWILWIGILGGTTELIFQKVERYDNRMGINMDTYHIYRKSILFMLGIAVSLLIIWQLLAYSKCKIRESFEKVTLLYAIGFGLLCFGVSIMIFQRYPGIERTNGSVITLEYVFCYPCAFNFALFSAAPSNICKVMIPYHNWLRWIIAVIFAIVFYLIWRA